MKRIVFLLSLFLLGAFFVGKSQTITYTPQTASGYQFKYLKADSGIAIPLVDTSLRRGVNRIGAMVARPQDSVIYFWNGVKWGKVSTDITGLTALINAKVDSLTVSGSILYYWKNGVAYGVTLAALSGTLQDVTDNGNITTNDIIVNNLYAYKSVHATQQGPGDYLFRTITTNAFVDSLRGYIQGDSLLNNNLTWQLPDTSGVFVMSVNGNRADKDGNVVISAGGTDSSLTAGFGLTKTTLGNAITLKVDTAAIVNLSDLGLANGAIIEKTSPNNFQTTQTVFGKMQGIVGTTLNFPTDGDVSVVNTNFINKQIDIFVNGNYTIPSSYDHTTGTVIFSDTLRTGDVLIFKATNYALNYNITPQPTGGYSDLIYTTTSNITSTSNTWTTTSASNSWGGIGLASINFTGDGEYIMQYKSSNGYNVIFGLNLTNAAQGFGDYEYGIYLPNSSGDVTDVTNGSPGSVRGTVTNNQWVRLKRTGTTVTIAKSTDKVSWTTLHTFGTTTSATLYLNLNIYSGATPGLFTAYYPQYKL